jgi:uncharacterized membrane protein YhaH (DUF805 family)
MTLAHWFSFNGRISRKTWWCYYFLLPNGFIIAAGLFDAHFQERDQISVVSIVALSTYILGFSGQVKRWHDLDKTGWWACLAMIPPFIGFWYFFFLVVREKGSPLGWVLVYFIPILGSLWSFFIAGFLRGTPGPNRFGPDPLAPQSPLNIALPPPPQ